MTDSTQATSPTRLAAGASGGPTELTPEQVVPAPGAPAPVDSTASGTLFAETTFGPADGTAVSFVLTLDGLDLVEDPAERTTETAVTSITLHLGGEGERGEGVLELFGEALNDTAVSVIDYTAETLSGFWSILSEGPDGAPGFRDIESEILSGETYIEVATVGSDAPDTAALRAQIEPVPLAFPTTIMEVQGPGHFSPFALTTFLPPPFGDDPGDVPLILPVPGEEYFGTFVRVSGVVTAVDDTGFYLQDPIGDGDPATSDAVFVAYDGDLDELAEIRFGQTVFVRGQVAEIVPGGTETGGLSRTTILADNVTVPEFSPAEVVPDIFPTLVEIGPGGRLPPTEVIEDDSFEVFEPETDGIDFYESLEGMLVSLPASEAISPRAASGEIYVRASGQEVSGLNERGGLTLTESDFNPERLRIDPDPEISGGVEIPEVFAFASLGPLEGVVAYEAGEYEIVPTTPFDVLIPEFLVDPGEMTLIEGDASTLTVATYNVMDLDPNDLDADADLENGRFDEIARQIVQNLNSPDVIALQEVLDNDGSAETAVVAADLTLATLLEAIDRADDGEANGSSPYAAIDTPEAAFGPTGTTAVGVPRNAFLYRTDRVEFVEGSLTTIGSQDEADPFARTPLPLVADFVFAGETVTLINTQLAPKDGSAPIMGAAQPVDVRQEDSLVNGGVETRRAQAQEINDFVDQLMMLDFPREFVLLGDMNELGFVSPVAEILPGPDGALRDLAETVDPLERWSVIREGNAQAFDHMFVSDRLAVTGVLDYVHTNAEFAETPARASDHDPLVAGFRIGSEAPRIIPGSDTADTLTGTEEDDAIGGFGGDDVFTLSGGSDFLNGGAGRDVLDGRTTPGLGAITQNPDGTITVAKGDDRVDTLRAIEEIALEGGTRVFDIEGEQLDEVYRLYSASLARTPDQAGLRFNLRLAEDGVALLELAALFVESDEFGVLYGEDPTAEAYVDALYLNTLGRAGDEGGRAFWISALEARELDRADALVAFSESPEHVERTAPQLETGVFVLDGLIDG